MLVYIVERLRRAQFSQLTGQCHEKRSTEAPGALTRLHLWEYALQCTYVSFIPFSSIKNFLLTLYHRFLIIVHTQCNLYMQSYQISAGTHML